MLRTTLGLCAAALAAVLGAYSLNHHRGSAMSRSWGYEVTGQQGWGRATGGRWRTLEGCVRAVRETERHSALSSANCVRYSPGPHGTVVERVAVDVGRRA